MAPCANHITGRMFDGIKGALHGSLHPNARLTPTTVVKHGTRDCVNGESHRCLRSSTSALDLGALSVRVER